MVIKVVGEEAVAKCIAMHLLRLSLTVQCTRDLRAQGAQLFLVLGCVSQSNSASPYLVCDSKQLSKSPLIGNVVT